MQRSNLDSKKRIIFILIVVTIIWMILIVRVFIIQLLQGKDWKERAEKQQYVSRTITASRGTIYDASGKIILAQSASVESVSINPMNISIDNKEKVAKKISEVFDLDYEKILKKVRKKTSIESIIKRVDKEKTNELRKWMEENNIYSGINIDEDTKRFYPYSSMASHVIGFVGSDNQGLEGIEAKYNDVLIGKNGSISKIMDAKGMKLGDTASEEYESSIQGNSLVLSIDMSIQAIVEKYLEEACIENECTDGGNVIIMNPQNGDILAMATYPFYDLNSPYKYYKEDILNIWNELDTSQKSKYLQEMWRNKAITDTYEPGSTFKLVTASAAIEEKIAETDKKNAYCCTGSIEIAGVRIKCWRYYRPHGSQSLREALMNSCNPIFIGLGQKIGVEKYYDYLSNYGFFNKTGIDLVGEANSIFLKKEKVGPVELATISFGQRFEVTPIQMISMVSTIANNGKYVKPRIVKKIINEQTGEEENIETEYKNQVISEDTAKKVLSMMTSVVSEGTGKNARVQGYNVGGKTGTSEDGVNTGKYVTSFIGVAPTDNPQICILVALYNPTGEAGHQGGTVAAPVAGKILNEVLDYLEIETNE